MSRRCYADESFDEAADRRYDETVQRDVDDAESIQDAYLEGQRAGARGVAAGLNPWRDPKSPEFQSWERGRAAAEAYRASREFNHRRRA
jgi:hypothetical protein